jgi:hypothetical protein
VVNTVQALFHDDKFQKRWEKKKEGCIEFILLLAGKICPERMYNQFTFNNIES